MDGNIKLIFLDIDGVLNNRGSTLVYGTEDELDPVSCGLMTKLLKETGAHIVVISNWRNGKSVDDLRMMLRKRAGKKIGRRVIGKIADSAPGDTMRGELIEAWQDINHHTGPYVVIDDKPRVTSSAAPYVVQPDSDDGFRIKDYECALEILSRKEG